jgi:hypothetical protein
MKAILSLLAGLLANFCFHAPAFAWASANAYGGHTTSGYGQTSHTNAAGGSTTHNWDGGTSHTNAAGGTTTGMYGAGAVHTTSTGYSTYHPPAYPTNPIYHPPAAGYPGGYHPPVAGYPAYAPYHPPVAVPYYSSGCYNCAGAAAAGVIVGAAVGASVASANSAAAASNAYAAGVATGSANTSAAYSSGYVAGASGAPYSMGVNYAALPSGAIVVNKYGTNYYLLGNTWFKPAYGANGVYYSVVPAP